MNTKKLYSFLPVIFILILAYSSTYAQTGSAKIIYTRFTVNAVSKKIVIDWVTDSKVAANYFEIERSVDGINFKTIAVVLGPDPKEVGGESYECMDKPLASTKKYYYRLKHVSTDGEEELSETKMLAIN